MSTNCTIYVNRYLVGVTIEAKTPLSLRTGEGSALTDALVALDVNGYPYIPASSIAGVVRHSFNKGKVKGLFGFQNQQEGHGSNVIFTEAKILDSKGMPVDGYATKEQKSDSLLKEFAQLPIRQHNRIGKKGVTEGGGKFDNQVVYAGTRFYFEIEVLLTKGQKKEDVSEILEIISSEVFRLGGGTRDGYGKMEVVEMKDAFLKLSENDKDLELYLEKSSDLKKSKTWEGWGDASEDHGICRNPVQKYELILTPDNFFLFGSGLADKDVNMAPVKERKILWGDKGGELSNELTLIPATSVKGALRHRTVYHYNRIKQRFADLWDGVIEKPEEEADNVLFGYETENVHKPGILFFSDIIEHELNGKILNHVAIDRFTGGALESALYDEKPLYGENKEFKLEIYSTQELEGEYKDAFEAALNDLRTGMLPLGGGVNRGNGIFFEKQK